MKDDDVTYIVLVLLFLSAIFFCIGISYADDSNFKYIQPVDNVVNKLLKWDDTKTAKKYSDYGLYTAYAYPYLYALSRRDHLIKRATTIGSIQLINMVFTDWSKRVFGRSRPNKYDYRSHWSGHTSTAMANAGLVCMQDNTDKKINCKIAIGLGATVGYLRLAANYHWFSDVLVGGTVGFVNGKFIPTLIMEF